MKYLLQKPRTGGGAGHSLKTWVFGLVLSEKFNLQWIKQRKDQDLKFHKDVTAGKWLIFFGLQEEFCNKKNLLKDIEENKNILCVPQEVRSFNDVCGFIQNNIKHCDGFDIGNETRVLNKDQDLENIDFIRGWLAKKKINTSKSLCDKNFFNISLAIRRGDRILIPRLSAPNDLWFLKTLEETVKKIKTEKPIRIFIFSETYNASWHVNPKFKIEGKTLSDWLNSDHIHPEGKNLLKSFIDRNFDAVNNIYVDERGKPNDLNEMFKEYNPNVHLNENIFTVIDTLIESDCIIAPMHGTANICKYFKTPNSLDCI